MKNKIVPLAVVAAAVTAVLVGVGAVNGRSDDGRQLAGVFCTNPNAMPKPGACIQLSFEDKTAQGYTDSPNRVLTLRPGIYWLSVNDNATAHNYSLESPDGSDRDLTGVVDTPGWVTFKVNLTHGTWVLFCQPHRAMGMYVDLEVGGVGQVGS
jgi:hypothetical protein